MKFEEAKKYQNVFKSNLNKIKRRKYKSKREKSASLNIEIFYNTQVKNIELFDDYYSIASVVKYKKKEKEIFRTQLHVSKY